MTRVTRQPGLILSGLVILTAINVNVWHYEQAINNGEVVLLKLAPVDPRSLMQGDYMRLNYDIAREAVASAVSKQHNKSNMLVIRLDKHQVASWEHDGNPEQLTANQRLLQVRQNQRQWHIGPDAFYFEEGTGQQYEAARYGEFRLQGDGKALLIGLRDEAYRPIGSQRVRW